MLLEGVLPRKYSISGFDFFLIFLNSLFIALGIFANLAFEKTGLDLIFFGSVMLLGLYLLFFRGKKIFHLPVTFYFTSAYTIGVVGTFIYKIVFSKPF